METCDRCHAVWYCSRDHQVRDFPRHKLECKHQSKWTDLEFKTFSTPKELSTFPLGVMPQVSIESRCFICHSSGEEVKLGRTPCCKLPVCDNEHAYEFNSYSRNFCRCSHVMYTKCHDHFEAKHEGDWRECTVCNIMSDRNVRAFTTTNGFNYSPTLEENLPRVSFLTMPCNGCDNRILPGHDGSTYSKGFVFCGECNKVPGNSREHSLG